MGVLKLNKFKNILYFFVLVFPLVIVLKSAAINITLVIISFISLLIIKKNKDYHFFKGKFIRFLILFFLFIFINTLFHFQNLETVIKSIANFRFLLLTFAVFLTLEKINKKNFFKFIYFNFALIVLIGFDIIFQYNFGKNIFGILPGMCDTNFENCVRFSGIFGSELIAGAYISQIGLLIFFLTNFHNKIKKNVYSKISNYIFLLFIMFIILISGERNAFLIFLIAVLLFFFIQKNINFSKFLIITSILFIILFIAIQNSQSIKTRFLDFYLLAKKSYQEQISFVEVIKNNPWSFHYRAAYELFLQKPILGHGYKSFRNKCSTTKIDKLLIEQKHIYKDYRACSTHPHSYVMEFLSENGIIGLLFYLAIIIYIFFKILNLRINDENNNLLAIGIGSLILAILFPIKPSGSFFTTFNASILFYLLGFFLYYMKNTK